MAARTRAPLRLAVPILLLAATAAFAGDPFVVLATTRAGRIEAFSASLGRLGSIGVNQFVESVSASPDGHKLYIAQEQRGECCGLYSLDMETHTMCPFVGRAMFVVPSADGRYLVTQDSSRGLEIFDAGTLQQSVFPTMKARGTYNLEASPDGRWVLGITNSDGPALDIFDLKNRAVDHRLVIPKGPATGAWAGDGYYVFSYEAPGIGHLWRVEPEDTKLGESKEIQLPDLHGACNEPAPLMLAGAADKLFLAEAFGFKLDRRNACPNAALGGIYVIQPSTGHVSRIAPSVRVSRMVVSPDGNDLYVIHSSNLAHQGDVRLIHLDAEGRSLSSVTLESGDWNLALTHTPAALIPRGYVRAAISCAR